MNTTTTAPTKYGWPIKCVNVSDLLGNVTEEIKTFEAKQLAKFKGELEAFDKKKTTVSDTYKQKYDGLVRRWCCVTSDMEVLHRTLICLFGKDAWKGYVADCVCPKLSEIAHADAHSGHGDTIFIECAASRHSNLTKCSIMIVAV